MPPERRPMFWVKVELLEAKTTESDSMLTTAETLLFWKRQSLKEILKSFIDEYTTKNS